MKAALATAAALIAFALAGCADDAPELVEDDIPANISRQQVEELEARILEEFPRAFSFPGQGLAEPVTKLIEGVVGPGGGIGLEPIDDDSVADFGGDIIPHDISDLVPVGQPVELRVALKWFGDPGAAADLDIYANLPGTYTTHSTGNEQSWNWAIINKQAVFNTVRVDGEPFEVGIQAQNGKIVHPDGMRYQIEVQAHFVQGVVAPFTPWEVTVPEGATGLIIESEPVTGDEHVQTEIVIIDPADDLHRVVVHNDIGTETLFIPTTRPGDYIVYIAEQHGGFVRLETDIPNPASMARALEKTVTETVVASGVLAAPAEPRIVAQGTEVTAGAYAEEGAVESTGTPLDVAGFIRPAAPGAVVVDAVFDIINGGVVHGTAVQGAIFSDDAGRLGGKPVVVSDRAAVDGGDWSYGFRGNLGLNAEAGYIVTGYTR